MANRVQQHRGFARACAACFQRKARCNMPSGKVPCSNCELHGTRCLPRTRKRKHDPLPQEAAAAVVLQQPAETTQQIQKLPSRGSIDAGPCLTIQNESSDPVSPPPGTSLIPPAVAQVDLDDYYGVPMLLSGDEKEGNEATAKPSLRIDKISRSILQSLAHCELPSFTWKSSLIDNFIAYVKPLMPILDPRWLKTRPDYTPPLVLMKTVLLVGSRVTNREPPFSCDEYYSAIKAMIFFDHQQPPIIKVAVACMLGWYNQAGIYTVTVDSSAAWIRYASNIAYQIGLHKDPKGQKSAAYRRRLWWTLVARDCQISTGQGRPRAFNLEDCQVKAISIQDFVPGDTGAELFVAYVQLCLILGDLTDYYRRKKAMSAQQKDSFKHRLLWWLRTLPCHVRHPTLLTKPTSDNLLWRQLFVIYFTVIALLYKTGWSAGSVHPHALIASSFMTTFLEGFLARDELQRLPAIFSFYATIAAIPQIEVTKHEKLKASAETDLGTLLQVLAQLSARFPSSRSAFKNFQMLKRSREASMGSEVLPIAEAMDGFMLFEGFSSSGCRIWPFLVDCSSQRTDGITYDEVSPNGGDKTRASIIPSTLGAGRSSIEDTLGSPLLEAEGQNMLDFPLEPCVSETFVNFLDWFGDFSATEELSVINPQY